MADIDSFWQAVNRRDWTAVGALLAPDFHADWPQSREYADSPEAFLRFEAGYPGDWSLELVEARADAEGAVSRIAFTDAGGTVPGITFFRFADDGRIASIEEYWPEPYDPPVGQEGRLPRR